MELEQGQWCSLFIRTYVWKVYRTATVLLVFSPSLSTLLSGRNSLLLFHFDDAPKAVIGVQKTVGALVTAP